MLCSLAMLLLLSCVAPVGDDVRTKGPHEPVQVWLDAPDGAVRLDAEAPLGPGDRIQLRYRGRGRFVTFLGRDAEGTLEVYGTWPVGAAGTWEDAPFSLVLDEVRGGWQVYVVHTRERPELEPIVAAIEADEPLQLGVMDVVRLEVR